ncbi:transposase IS4 family protein [Thiorhodococcus drewsii AZ1]|uniref:Transposase IS4 family protein n=1 Tax=Thiorhodococcus drewsii AZ1 TaxID=765913 RepID=G2DZR4_9GAMM|nr:IS4 family transposase [Thiorhodococcus drewsii]EGV31953.1 transposase IS4 family protein [Thiorhodococcus drewsii AZ1]
MPETRTVRLLRTLLATHLDWHGSRLDFLARFILAVLQVRSVNLARLAPVLSSRAKPSSNYIRLQRFMRSFTMDQSDIARTVGDLLPAQQPWVLTLDRTNWKLGRAEINLLVLGVAYRGLAIPLLWTALPKAGNSNTKERIALMERFFATFPGQPVAFLLADREFVGRDWLAYLLQRELPFRLRLKANVNLTSTKGSYPLLREFQTLAVGGSRVLRQPRRLWGQKVFLSAKRLETNEWLLIVSESFSRQAIEEYAQRWTIETLFAALKSHGFHLEETHLTKPERLERLFALLTLATLWALHTGVWAHEQQPIRQKKHSSALSSASFATDSTSFSASSPCRPVSLPNCSASSVSCSMGDRSTSNMT